MTGFRERLQQIIDEYSADSVLIYQMGKVGSTSLEVSLINARHFHTLYSNHPCKVHDTRRRKHPVSWVLKLFGNALKRALIRRRGRVKIISLVREPYGRNVSMFFQDLPLWMSEYQDVVRFDSRNEGPEFLFEAFENAYDHFYFDRWFDRELKRLTGIDIFEHPFDKERGYEVIRRGKYEVLLLKLEKLEKAHEAIEAFVGYRFDMQDANRGERKWYACLYDDFKKKYRPSEAHLTKLYLTKTVRHFYSEEEVAGYLRRYLERPS